MLTFGIFPRPSHPIPGDGGVIGWLKGSGTAIYHHLPHYMGSTFTAACQFLLIANQITLNYLSGNEDSGHDVVTLEFAEYMYHKLLDWSDQAQIDLTGDAADQQHRVVLHMWIHCRILDIFRPFVAEPLQLQTFAYGTLWCWR